MKIKIFILIVVCLILSFLLGFVGSGSLPLNIIAGLILYEMIQLNLNIKSLMDEIKTNK